MQRSVQICMLSRCFTSIPFVSCLYGIQVAKDDEVMVAISNSNYAMPGGMLDTWMESVKRANVSNAMVIALDKQTKEHAESMGMAAHYMTVQVRLDSLVQCRCHIVQM